MITLKGNPLHTYEIEFDGAPTSKTASEIFTKYVSKLCGEPVKGGSALQCSFTTDLAVDDEYFLVKSEGNDLRFSGGKRGVIYGVYEFLEKCCGCRFFAFDDEYIPTEDISVDEVRLEGCSVVKFREILGNSSGNNAESFLKFRLNSNAWFNKLKEEHGGGYSYAGIPAHTLTGEFLLADYQESHPQIFSLVNGKRMTDRYGQICFCSDEVVPIAVKEVLKLLDKNPNATFVSVSQGDNENFCQCEGCKKLYEKHSLIDLYVEKINAIAREVKKKYPKVLVHTFAYNSTAEQASDDIFFEDNVILQYCFGGCKNHIFTDENCLVNREAKKTFDKLSRLAKNILVWDYPNCFKYQLVNRPALRTMRQDIAYLASHSVRGIFNEYVHNDDYGACQFAEMKTYLLSKLMWNPDMSEEEYLTHYEEFMKFYYGAGYKYLMEYLALWEGILDRADLHFTYDSRVKNIDGNREGKYLIEEEFIPEAEQAEFLRKAGELWEKAAIGATPVQADRIRREKIQYLYLKQALTFDKMMAGSKEEQEAALAANEYLIDEITHYNVRLTFWGYTVQDQNAELHEYARLAPQKWKYDW